MRKILTLFSFFLLALVAHAHGLWIEVAGIGTVGQPQTVNVFFGDPAERMPTDRWFGNLRDVQLTLVSPSGKEMPLPSLTLSADQGTATFTPDETGVYRIKANHLMNRVARERKSTYQSDAFIAIGTATPASYTAGAGKLQVVAPSGEQAVGKAVSFQFIKDGQPAKKTDIRIVASDGVVEKYTTDKRGNFTYTPKEAGTYLVQFSEMKEGAGTYNGQAYQRELVSLCYAFTVK